MNTLNGFLSAITNTVKSATGINLDPVQPAPLVTHIALSRWCWGLFSTGVALGRAVR